jgi:putative salt-induced outer membrane protein YdiY
MKKWSAVLFLILASVSWANAMEIYLNNGDKISGVVVREDDRTLVLKTMAADEVTISKAFIDRQKTYPEEYATKTASAATSPADVEWKKHVSLGYTRSGGNTRKTQGILSANVNRKTKFNEATFKFDSLYSTGSNEKVDARKYYGLLRYANSFGRDLKWYNFYKLEGDQDRFSNIDYRVIPSVGRGYWFSDTEDWKLMTEAGVGYQYTNFVDNTKSKGEVILTPRLFLDKRLVAKLHLTEDLTVYPSLDNTQNYRLRSETALVNQISEHWSGKIQLIDNYNSNPQGTAKKNDYTFITALEYNF